VLQNPGITKPAGHVGPADQSGLAQPEPRRFSVAGIPPSGLAFLALTATISLLWSCSRLILWDEFFVLWTDSVSSIGEIVHIERTWPLYADPLAYHLMAHAAIRLFGAGAFAIRIPSLLGFLLMQICLFFFVRRIAGERAGVAALALPAISGWLFYSQEGRSYGLLLGLFGLAIVSWQTATRYETKRAFALIVLAVAIALALNTHYFGVLLLIPLTAAEFFRIFERRRLDLPVLASIGAGSAGILFVVPFMRAAMEFRANHLRHGNVRLQTVGSAFVNLLTCVPQEERTEAILLAIIAISALAVLWGFLRLLRARAIQLPACEAVLLIALCALPFFGYLLASLTSHTFEPRFVVGSLFGTAALLAISLSPAFRREPAWNDALLLLFLSLGVLGVVHILAARISSKHDLSALTVTPQIKQALLSSPSQQLYFQNVEVFEFANYYEPDPDIRSRMTLVYSRDQEMRWNHMDTSSLHATHMRNFTPFKIVPYESLTTQPGDHLFVNYGGDLGPDFTRTDKALAAAHANVKSSTLHFNARSCRFAFFREPRQLRVLHNCSLICRANGQSLLE